MGDRLRFAIAGASKRSDYLYAPLLNTLKDDVELVGVWDRSEEKGQAFGERYRIPAFSALARLRDAVRPDAMIVSVANSANGEIGRRVIELGCHALLETPIAARLEDADAIIRGAQDQNLKVEVAEQYYRRPMERLKKALIDAGIFGRVLVACSDFMGHAYHGISLIRSYVGFDVPVLSVNCTSAEFSVAPHYSWIDHQQEERQEEWEHGEMHFANGSKGFFDWSSLSYDSALRWQRSTRFFAERGMGVGERWTVLSPDGKDPQRILVERHIHNVGGMETLSELVAHTTPEIVWRNPFRGYAMDDETIAVAACLMSLVKAIREDGRPEYGPVQARLDQQVYLGMLASAAAAGRSVELASIPIESAE